MALAEQWDRILRGLPADWEHAELRLIVPQQQARARAATLLGPLAPGRVGEELRFSVSHTAGIGPHATRRLLVKVDGERIGGRLALAATAARRAAAEAPRAPLAAQWHSLVEALPGDWSDLLCRVTLVSSDDLPRAALLAAPLNPSRPAGEVGFDFRAARNAGYGVSGQMARRCLARMDEAGIPGTVEILRALSDTQHAATQGPVWYVGGKVL